MARVLWLADVLRAAGLQVVEYDQWKTRGREDFGPVKGIVCHHTGSSIRSTDSNDVRQLALTGTPSAPTVPISQLFLSRSGFWWVLASGTATGVKTGTGGPLKGYGDDAVIQVEAQHAGATEQWTPEQYNSYVRGCAAIAAHLKLEVKFVIGHKEHQPGDKNDPSFDMALFRRDVAAVMGGKAMGFLDDKDARYLAYRMHDLAEMVETVTTPQGEKVLNKLVTTVKQLAVDMAEVKTMLKKLLEQKG